MPGRDCRPRFVRRFWLLCAASKRKPHAPVSIEECCAEIERGIIEVPFRRIEFPNKVELIGVEASPSAFRGKINLESLLSLPHRL
jgi:hypothetical protein